MTNSFKSLFILKDQCESVAVLEEKPGHFTDEKISKQTDDLQTQTDYGKLKTETDEDDSVPLDEGTFIHTHVSKLYQTTLA